MALLGSSASSAPSIGLTPTYINSLIQQTLSAQRQPIYTLTARRDQLNIKKAVYSDLKTKLLALNSIVDDLDNDDGNSIFDSKVATSSDSDLLTATVSSEAISGEYTVIVTNLAEAHMVGSDIRQSSTSDALDLSGTFTLNGQEITVETDDSLENIVGAINAATYADGSEATATIVDNYLVIEAASSGTDNELSASDNGSDTVLSDLGILSGGSFTTTLRTAENASFKVNNIIITRDSNTGIDDVIDGVTLNLAGESADEVTLDVTPDYTAIRSKISAFVSNLNSTLTYLKAKTGTTADQEKEVYTRGVLAGDTIFSMLRADMVGAVGKQTPVVPPLGDPTYLSEVGITIGSDLEISLDTDELNTAMESDLDAVAFLFDGVMDRFLYALEPFTTSIASSNTIDLYSSSIDTRMDNIDTRIDRIEKLLVVREEMLIQQYSALYLRNLDFTQQQYGMLGIYSNFSAMA